MKELSKKDELKRLEERVNPRTGKVEYRREYHWYGDDGKRHHSRTGWMMTPEEAIEAYKEAVAEKAAGTPQRSQEPTLQMIIEQYNAWLMSDDCKMMPGSIRTHEKIGVVQARSLPDRIAKTRLSKIGTETVAQWTQYYCTQYRKADGGRLSPNSFSNHKKYISHVLEWMTVYTSWSQKRPSLLAECKAVMSVIKSPDAKSDRNRKKAQIDSSEYWTIAEFYAVLDQIPYEPVPLVPITGPEDDYRSRTEDPALMPQPLTGMDGLRNVDEMIRNSRPRLEVTIYTMFCMLFYAGLRFEEVRALTWDDVDWTERRIDVHTAKNYRVSGSEANLRAYREAENTTKNASSNRYVLMLPPLYNALRTYWYIYKEAYGNDDGLIFIPSRTTMDGMMSPNSVQNWINKWSAIAGVKCISPHRFRHSCAMYLAVDLRLPKERAALYFGHTDTAMLDRCYLHLSKEMKAAAVARDLDVYGSTEDDWQDEEEKQALANAFLGALESQEE